MRKEGKVRVAVIGCGCISRMHLRAYSSNNNVQLVAVVDTDQKKALTKADEFNTKFYTDHNKLIREQKIEAASVCVPSYLHREVVLDLIKNKVHVLCEKPLAVKVADAEKMITEAENAGSILIPAFCWRFYTPLIKAKNWIKKGKIGKLLMFRFRFGSYMNVEGKWYSEKEKGGGIIKDSAVHAFDLFRWLIGEVEDVSARKGTLDQNIGVEDSFISLLRSKEGVLGVLEGSWATPFSGKSIEIYGSRASITVDVSANKARFNTDKFVEIMESNEEKHNRFRNEIDHFIKCIQGECESLVTGKDGMEAIKIADAVAESIEKKRWILLP